MHWGHYHSDVEKIDFIDFHLAGTGTVDFKNPDEIYHIPLCSRNFIRAVVPTSIAVRQHSESPWAK